MVAERCCGELVKYSNKSSDARHSGTPTCRGDSAPACAKRWRGACAVLWGRPADSVSAGIAGDTSKLRSRQRLHWGRWRGTWLQASCVSNAGSCAMDGGGLQDDCRRTAQAGHGGENALRICIFCDMSGRLQATPRGLQVIRGDYRASSNWRGTWLQASSVTVAVVRRGTPACLQICRRDWGVTSTWHRSWYRLAVQEP